MKKFLSLLGLAIAVGAAVYIIFYSFANPDMTRTRVFLNRWYIELLMFIGTILWAALRNDY